MCVQSWQGISQAASKTFQFPVPAQPAIKKIGYSFENHGDILSWYLLFLSPIWHALIQFMSGTFLSMQKCDSLEAGPCTCLSSVEESAENKTPLQAGEGGR